MNGRWGSPYAAKYRIIVNGWSHDSSCTVTSLSVWDLKNVRCLVLLHRVYKYICVILLSATEVSGIINILMGVKVSCLLARPIYIAQMSFISAIKL
jgi:hypothetical protein